MSNNSKKQKKQAQIKESEVKDLAADILSNTISEETNDEQLPEFPEIIDTPDVPETPASPQTYEKIPHQHKEALPPPVPVVFKQGQFKTNAFVIARRAEEMHSILGQHFGFQNGDFFIINENTSTCYNKGDRKRYKCILVEDKNGFRYGLWFDMTKAGTVY